MAIIKFTKVACSLGVLVIALLWLWTLLLTSDDVQPNHEPFSMSYNNSLSNFSNSLNDFFSFLNSLNLSKHLSFIHYNVQRIANKKLDILTAELLILTSSLFQKPGLRKSKQKYLNQLSDKLKSE